MFTSTPLSLAHFVPTVGPIGPAVPADLTPLELRDTPTEFKFTNDDGEEVTLSLARFNQDTPVALRGDKSSKTLKAVKEILGGIPDFKTQGCLGGNTRILLSAVERPLSHSTKETIMKAVDTAFLTRGGILVPLEHVLAYTRALFLRHQIMAVKGKWGKPSASTKNRAKSARAEQTRIESTKKGTHKGTHDLSKRRIADKAKRAAAKKAAAAITKE
jgi:hypothetical protein